VPSQPDRTGSLASDPLAGAASLAREWAGSSCLALLLAGSHASGEAVWIDEAGRSVCLSDVDLYAVMPDRTAQRAAAARARAARAGLTRRLLGLGLAAPLEVAFLTPPDLERLPARPATLELARHGRVLSGEPEWLGRVPRYTARDIPFEERLLMLENRGFELLWAHAYLESEPIQRWRARHEVLKCALDLAGALALARGEYPAGAAARVAAARSRGAEVHAALPALWDRALAWRRAPSTWPSASAAREEWHTVSAAWAAVWETITHPLSRGEADRVRRARALAGRARTRRRLRQAFGFGTGGGAGPGTWTRLRFAARGTPQHRLNASAAVLLLGAPGGGERALSTAVRAALADLGVLSSRESASFASAARALVRRWDEWILDGQRGAESA
jgi:hypothetical protein